MPAEVVHIDLKADTAPRRRNTDVTVGIIGTALEAPPGDVGFGEAYRATSPDDVLDEFGEDSDVHVASQQISEMGARFWWVLVLEATEYENESVDDGEELANLPVLGDYEATSADGDIIFVTDDPVDTPDDGYIAINADTGQVALAADISGPVEITYTSASFDDLEEYDERADRISLANQRVDQQYIGELNELATYADEYEKGVIVAYEDADELESQRAAQELAWDVGEYVPSGDMAAFAHRGSNDDVAATILGQLAVNPPWFDLMYDGEGYPLSARDFRSRKIGNPRLSGTFEGGDPENQRGPANVIMEQTNSENQDVWVASNSLTTAGRDSDYLYFDIAMTQYFLADEIRVALTRARMKNDQIPFTEDGRAIIKNVITDTVEQYVGGTGQPLAEADVIVPEHDELDEDDRANRIWTGIDIDGRLAGNTHEFGLTLTVGV